AIRGGPATQLAGGFHPPGEGLPRSRPRPFRAAEDRLHLDRSPCGSRSRLPEHTGQEWIHSEVAITRTDSATNSAFSQRVHFGSRRRTARAVWQEDRITRPTYVWVDLPM